MPVPAGLSDVALTPDLAGASIGRRPASGRGKLVWRLIWGSGCPAEPKHGPAARGSTYATLADWSEGRGRITASADGARPFPPRAMPATSG